MREQFVYLHRLGRVTVGYLLRQPGFSSVDPAGYALVMHTQLPKASRAQKGNLLDEFVEVTGYHRNYAKKLLYGPPLSTGKVCSRTGRRKHAGGRPIVYGSGLIKALCTAAEATGWICGNRLVGVLPEIVSALEQEGKRVASLCLPLSERHCCA